MVDSSRHVASRSLSFIRSSFFKANLSKFIDGGYVPIIVGVKAFSSSWSRGTESREALRAYLAERTWPLSPLPS